MVKINKPRIGWKVLEKGMKSTHGNMKWKKNKWYKHKEGVIICESGFHGSKLLVDAIRYVTPCIICKVEYKGEYDEQYDKFVCSEMRILETYRFTKRMAVMFSIFCSKNCINNFEKVFKDDARPRLAIIAAENYLKSPSKKNKAAAWSARSAAISAAESAARSAWSARSAAISDAESAAWSARSAAESAESAARSAAMSDAESAAMSAAWSAESAAESAAMSAAMSARSAVKKKLNKELLKIIGAK